MNACASRVAILVVALVVLACGSEDPEDGPLSRGTSGEEEVLEFQCPALPPDPDKVRVLVLDDGFDPRHPAFQSKIAGCYRLSCPELGEPPAAPAGESEDDAAVRFVESLTQEPDCQLTPGAVLRVDSYFEHFNPARRDEWNRVMLQKERLHPDSPLDAEHMLYGLLGVSEPDPLGGTESLFTYHGTATAGAIAHDSDVELVLVERELSDPGSIRDAPCIPPEEIALEMRLLERSDVREAFVRAPLTGMDKALVEVRRSHGIRIENRSFGTPPTRILNRVLAANDCPEVPLAEYFALRGELERDREAYLRGSGALEGADPLVFQSAGNEGERIETAEDDLQCTPDRTHRLLVGSYDIYRNRPARSDFTNYGECVDLYAFGESVIVPAPAGFYVPVFGTSISTPLAVRYAAQRLAGSSLDAEALRDEILSARDELRFLPIETMPVELGFNAPVPVRPLSVPGSSSGVLRHVSASFSGSQR